MWPPGPREAAEKASNFLPGFLVCRPHSRASRTARRGEGRGQRQEEGGEEAARASLAKAGAGIHRAPGPRGHSRRALRAGPPDPPPRLSRLASISVGIVAKARKIIFGAALSPPGKDSKLCCARDPRETAAAARPGKERAPEPRALHPGPSCLSEQRGSAAVLSASGGCYLPSHPYPSFSESRLQELPHTA